MALLNQAGFGNQYEESDGSKSMQVRVVSAASGSDSSEAADGAAAPTLTQQVGGKDGGGNLQTLLTDTAGNLASIGATDGAKVVTDANGTIQQYLRGLVTFFANALGAGTAAAAHRVTLASDDPLVVLAGAPTTGAKSNVNDGASSVTILAANASRKGALFWNDSTVALYLDLSGGTATTTSCSVKVPADGLYELPDNGKRGVYTGLITGIWSSDASGAVRVTEFT